MRPRTSVLLLIGVFLLSVMLARSEEKYRIERLSGQQLGNGVQVVAYHDTESGIEILCFYDRTISGEDIHLNTAVPETVSCLATGRSWKK